MNWGSPFAYFTDSVLRGPTIGCMLMCLAASLVGVIVFLRKQSLVGEALSHATYPGVTIGVIVAGALSLGEAQETSILLLIMLGAFLSAFLGLWTIHKLELSFKIKTDAALCFVLSSFFGIGLTLASDIQFSHSSLYRQVQSYLFGQAATMTDTHILIYGILSAGVIFTLFLFYKEIQLTAFNREFAKSLGVPVQMINVIIFILTVSAVVIGLRSVGVVLMSAMLIAPAVTARQFTNKLHIMLALAALFGICSGFFGNYLSVEITKQLSNQYPTSRLALPTGPMIVITASILCFFALLMAPERGFLLRYIRIARFRYRCIGENLLKNFWHIGLHHQVTLKQLEKSQEISRLYLYFILRRLVKQGWVEKVGKNSYRLTAIGQLRASQIVRLHRLWEVYLADYVGVGPERVHRNAEEIEHILTPELEQELTLLLKDPKLDPHHQRIPPKKGI